MVNNVIEIVNFKLSENASIEEFNRANDQFQTYIGQQEGVLYRSLAKQANSNIYIDVVYFATMDDAKRVQEAFFASDICQQFAALIEKDSVIMEHYDVLSQTCNG